MASAVAASARADDAVPFLGVSVGLGYSFPADTTSHGQVVNGSGDGGWFAVEYVDRRREWLAPHVYSGVLNTSPSGDCGPMVLPCDVSAKIFFMGAKARLMVPIPYVGPFLDLGLGASVGTMRTRSGALVDDQFRGATFHIPFGLGLAVGPRHQFEISLQYLFHPLQHQIDGAAAVGMSFALL